MSRWIIAALMMAIMPSPVASGASPRGKEAASRTPAPAIELDFAAADRSLWGDGGWFSTPEYHALGKQTFGGVRLRANYSKRRDTWDSGLEMAARERRDGMIEVKVKATVNNPGGNDDRRITVRLEVVNRGEPVQSGTIGPFEAEDNGNDLSDQTTLLLRRDALSISPMTRLRLVVTAEEE